MFLLLNETGGSLQYAIADVIDKGYNLKVSNTPDAFGRKGIRGRCRLGGADDKVVAEVITGQRSPKDMLMDVFVVPRTIGHILHILDVILRKPHLQPTLDVLGRKAFNFHAILPFGSLFTKDVQGDGRGLFQCFLHFRGIL